MKIFFKFAVLFCGLMASFVQGQEVKVVVNHIGYEAEADKRAVILGHVNDEVTGFAVVDYATGKSVLLGQAVKAGPVAHWKDWVFWTTDFGAVKAEGTYAIECTTSKGS